MSYFIWCGMEPTWFIFTLPLLFSFGQLVAPDPVPVNNSQKKAKSKTQIV